MAILIDDQLLAAIDVRKITTDCNPEELVLPPETEKRLGWLSDWLLQPRPIFKEWGLQRYIDSGLRVLFRGPPGTGKTMAVTALGRSTERPVLAVDVGTIVSTYMAETNKNLQRLFDAAREQNAILLFDQADAMFGKRIEAKDAHDRYVSSDIAYLLRQIELFDGLAIITADIPGKMDPEAISRIDVVIDFPMPDAPAREQLWRNILGQVKLRQGKDVDIGALASKHELCGADILRAVRLAAVLAAIGGKGLDMELLQFAAAEQVAMCEPQRGWKRAQ